MTDLSSHPSLDQGAAIFNDLPEFAGAVSDYRARSTAADILTIRRTLQARAQRGLYFSSRLFSDPAWDILLQLYAAALMQRKLTVSRLTKRSGVPMTTAIRWLATLESEGLLTRQEDPLDGRQVYVSLSAKGLRGMQAYFEDLEEDTDIL